MSIISSYRPQDFNIPVISQPNPPGIDDTRYVVPTVWVDTKGRHVYMFLGINANGHAVWRDITQAQTSGGGVPADNSVGNNQIQDNAVTTSKIQDDAVTTPKIADDAITTDLIEDNAVTSTKISQALRDQINASGASTINVDGAAITALLDSGTINFTANGSNASAGIVSSSIQRTHLSSGVLTSLDKELTYNSNNVSAVSAGSNIDFTYDTNSDTLTIASTASGTATPVTYNSNTVSSIADSTQVSWGLASGVLTGSIVDGSITSQDLSSGLRNSITSRLQYMSQDVENIVAGDRVTLSYTLGTKTLSIASLGGGGANSLNVDGLTITRINDSNHLDWTSSNAVAVANIKDNALGLTQLSSDINRRLNPISISSTTSWGTTTDAIAFALVDYQGFGANPTSTQIRSATYARRVNSGSGDIILRINKSLTLSQYRVERIVGTNTAPVSQGIIPVIFAASGFSYRVVPSADDAVYDYWIYTTVPGNPVDSTLVTLGANEYLRVVKQTITYSTPSWTGDFRSITINDLNSSLQTMIATGGQTTVGFDTTQQKAITLSKVSPLTLVDRVTTSTVSSNTPIIWGGDGFTGAQAEASSFTIRARDITTGFNLFVRDSYVTANPLTTVFIRSTPSSGTSIRLVWPAQFGSTVMINSIAYRQYPFTPAFLSTNSITLAVGDVLTLERDVTNQELQVQRDLRNFNTTLTSSINNLVTFDSASQKTTIINRTSPITLVDSAQSTTVSNNTIWGGDGTTNTTEETTHTTTSVEGTSGINLFIRTAFVTAHPSALFVNVRSSGGVNRRVNLPSGPTAITINAVPYNRYAIPAASINNGDTLSLIVNTTVKILGAQRDIDRLEESDAAQNVNINANKLAISHLHQNTSGGPVPSVLRDLAPLLTLTSTTSSMNTPWTRVTPNIFNSGALVLTRLFSILDTANLSSRTVVNEFTDISGVRINSSSIELFYYANANDPLNRLFPGRNSYTESLTVIDNNSGTTPISSNPLKVLVFSMSILSDRIAAGSNLPLLRIGSSNTFPLLRINYGYNGAFDRNGIAVQTFGLECSVSRQDGGRRTYTERVSLGSTTFRQGGNATLDEEYFFHTDSDTPASVVISIRLFDNDNDLGVQTFTETITSSRGTTTANQVRTFTWPTSSGPHNQVFNIRYIGDSVDSPQISRSIQVQTILNNRSYIYVIDAYYDESKSYNAPVTYAEQGLFGALDHDTQYDFVATFYRNSTGAHAPINMLITNGHTSEVVDLGRSSADIDFSRLEFLSMHNSQLAISRVQYYSYVREDAHLTPTQIRTAWDHRDTYLGSFLPPSKHSSTTKAVDLAASLDVNAITVNGNPVAAGSASTSRDTTYTALTLTQGTPSRAALPSGKTITPATAEVYRWVSAQNTRVIVSKTIGGVVYSFRATQYNVSDGTNANISTVMGIRSLSAAEIIILGWVYPGDATTQQRANRTFNVFSGTGNVVISNISPINTPQPVEIWRPNVGSGTFASATLVNQTVLGGVGSDDPMFVSVSVSQNDILVVPTDISATTSATPVELNLTFGAAANYAFTTPVTAVVAVPGRTTATTSVATETLVNLTFDNARQKTSFEPKTGINSLVIRGIRDKVIPVCWAARKFEETAFSVNTADASALYNGFRISIRESDYYRYVNSDNTLNLRLERIRAGATTTLTLPTFNYVGVPSGDISDQSFSKLIVEGRYEAISPENATTSGDMYRLVAHTQERRNEDSLVNYQISNFEASTGTARVPAGSTTTISTPTVRRWAAEELKHGSAAALTKTISSVTYNLVGPTYNTAFGSNPLLLLLMTPRTLTTTEMGFLNLTAASGFTTSQTFNTFLAAGTVRFTVGSSTIVEVWRPTPSSGTITAATRASRWTFSSNSGTAAVTIAANDILVVLHSAALSDISFVDITFASTGSYTAIRTATAAAATAGSTLLVHTTGTDESSDLTFNNARQKKAVIRSAELLPTVLKEITSPIPVAAAWGEQQIESFRFEIDDLDPTSFINNFKISIKASDFNRFLLDDGTLNLRLTRQRSNTTTTLTLPTFNLVENRTVIFSADQQEIIYEDRFEALSGQTSVMDGDVYRIEGVNVGS